jgi:3-oxoacyl-[acyl-carrier-protein] synthase-3
MYIHGQPDLVAQLGETGCAEPQLESDGLVVYRRSESTAGMMGAEVGRRALADADVTPDFILYATETADGGLIAEANAYIADAVGLPHAVVVTVGGHGCGNLGPLLRTANALLTEGRVESILVLTADRVGPRRRLLPGALSVLSDGAAAVMATASPPARATPTFLLRGLAMSADARGGIADVGPMAQLRTVQLGRAAVAALRAGTGVGPKDFRYALFSNYRHSAIRFMAGAAGFSGDQLLPGPVAEFGHCFAADLLVNCDLMRAAGAFTTGDRLALSATGPHSWTLMDLEVVEQAAEARA